MYSGGMIPVLFDSQFIFQLVLIIVSIIVLGVSCYTDIRTREIPDWASWGLVGFAMLVRVIMVYFDGWQVLISGVLGLAVALVIGLLMYYTHQWGGGDAKLLFAFGCVIGVSYPFSSESLQLGVFVLALFVGGAAWGLVWMVYEAVRMKGFFRSFGSRVRLHKKVVLGSVMSAVVLSLVLLYFSLVVVIPLLFFVPFVVMLFLFVKTVEQECFIRYVSPTMVTEGDWLADKVEVESVVIDKRTLEISDVRLIQKWHAAGKLDLVRIKYGVPFAPSFVVAYGVVLYWRYLF